MPGQHSKTAAGKHSRPPRPNPCKKFRGTATVFSALGALLMSLEAWLRLSIAAQAISAKLIVLAFGLVAAGITACLLRGDRIGLFALLGLDVVAGIICAVSGCIYMPAVVICGAGCMMGMQLRLKDAPGRSSIQAHLLTPAQRHVVSGGACIAFAVAAYLVDLLGIAGIRQMPACLDGAWHVLAALLLVAGMLLIVLRQSKICDRIACTVFLIGAIAASAVAFGVGTTTQGIGLINIYLTASLVFACGIYGLTLDR